MIMINNDDEEEQFEGIKEECKDTKYFINKIKTIVFLNWIFLFIPQSSMSTSRVAVDVMKYISK